VETIRWQVIEGQALRIDGTIFSDCTLVNCVLEYSGLPVIFERTQMRGCRYVFFGPARSTVHFLQGVGLMSNDQAEWGEFSPIVH
jgi:hypothetical protein